MPWIGGSGVAASGDGGRNATGGVVNMSAQDHMGLDLSAFRPDRNAAAGGALPKVHGTTR